MSLPDENMPLGGENQRMTLLEKLRQGKAGRGPVSRAGEQATTSRAVGGPEPSWGHTTHGQHRMETAEEPTLLDHAAREPMTMGGFRGPRGRRVEGYPGLTEHQAGGLPPVLAPWKPVDFVAKDDRLPDPSPHQVTRYVDIQVTVATGRLLDRDAGHPINTLQIHNYSKQWLYIPSAGMYIMPYCVGVQIPIPTAANKLEVDAAAPPGLTQPSLAGAAANQVFVAVAMEECKEFSPGLSILNAGALP